MALFDESEVLLQHASLLDDEIGQKLNGVVGLSVHLVRTVLLNWQRENESQMVVWVLGARIVNGFGAATKLLECGYFGPTSAQLRDMAETGNLLDYFNRNPHQIDDWRTSVGKDRYDKYGFGKTRDNLDSVWKKRFDFHSEYGTHPSGPSIYAVESGGNFHTGPHFSDAKFRGFYKDLALDASLVTRSFVDCLSVTFAMNVSEKHHLELVNFETAEATIGDIYGPL